MDVGLGAEVVGSEGERLGTIKAVIADARIDRVTEIVVDRGFLGGRDCVVTLPHILSVDEAGKVYLDLDAKGLEASPGFTGPERADYSDYVGTPGTDQEGVFRGDLQFDSIVAAGAQSGAGKLLGFPGGEQLTPDIMDRPSIYAGIDVLDELGEKVGELDDFFFDHATGAPTRLSMKRGFLFRKETDLPVEWVKDLTDDGILLNVAGSQVEALVARQ